MTDQSWLELQEERISLGDPSWTVVRADNMINQKGEFNKIGYSEDYYQVSTIAVPNVHRLKLMNHDLKDFVYAHTSMEGDLTYLDNSSREFSPYCLAGTFSNCRNDIKGIGLVISTQVVNDKIWYLNQDFIVKFGLVQKGDTWIRPVEMNVEVAKLIRDNDGNPIELRIKTEFLKDYLCALGLTLQIITYFERQLVCNSDRDINWLKGETKVDDVNYSWEGSKFIINELGMMVKDEEAYLAANECGSIVDNKKVNCGLLFKFTGRLWRRDFVEPATVSMRVLHDEPLYKTQFYFKNDGTKDEIDNQNKYEYLWFNSNIITRMLVIPHSSITWEGYNVGYISVNDVFGLTFGVNESENINVLAVDIERLPSWLRGYWAGENIVPDLDPCRELVQAQMKSVWITTEAPEVRLERVYKIANQNAMRAHDGEVITPHLNHEQIWQNIHRFRVKDDNTLYSFAKDLWRLLVEKINGHALSNYALPPKNQKVGSIGHLEAVLATQIDDKEARRLAGYFVAINSIRQADAHSGSHDLQRGLDLLGLTDSMSAMSKALQMIIKCTETLEAIANFYQKLTDVKA